MERMKFETPDMVAGNVEKIGAMFPNCVTEAVDEEKSTPEKTVYKKAINFELLRQMLSRDVVEGDEAYEFTWVGKKAAIVEANKPIRATLRPCPEESVNWDTTENLYIEGDNLQVLKLLQESYLGKVKMIYIDPPYNTGHDFVYADNFRMELETWNKESGAIDEEGNRLLLNNDSNGRFHSDWCSMMYSRLALSRNLLAEDGVIFISIDDNEQDSLQKICSEVFGRQNYVATFVWQKRYSPDARKAISDAHEYIVCFAKNQELFKESRQLLPLTDAQTSQFKNPDNDPRGPWKSDNFTAPGFRPNQMYEVINPAGEKLTPPPGRCWRVTYEGYQEFVRQERMYFGNDGKGAPGVKRFLSEMPGMVPWTWWPHNEVGHTQEATKEVASIMGNAGIFDFPKPVRLIKRILQIATNSGSIVLDFFSGSATTAHAVMQLNAEDGGHRKFIMVQLPEKCDESSEAYKAGYKTICDIGKERIRRAGKKIREENPLTTQDLDIGFRVLKLDSTNMKDVYYSPADVTQAGLLDMVSNIKEDRNDLDLLFGCVTDWALPLSLPYTSEQIDGCTVHTYNDGDLIACFDTDIPDSVIREIARRKPLRAVFRDASFADSPSKINVFEIFKLLAPDASVRVI